MSNSKTKTWDSAVPKNSNDILELDTVPIGEVWSVTEFGGSDVNVGDNKSSICILRWNGVQLDRAFLSLTGATNTVKGPWEVVGDGVKKLTVRRYNTSNSDKQIPVWVIAHQVS